MVSINDIAKEAGVSRGTVDRVLNHRGRVSAETAQKVTQIAERLGYKKSRAGAGLAVRKKNVQIGFVYPNDLRVAPFFAQLLKWSKEEAVHLQQYNVTVHFYPLAYSRGIGKLEESLHDLFQNNPEINGWVMPGNYVKYAAEELDHGDEPKIPIVSYNIEPEDMDRVLGHVGSDYIDSGRIACGMAALMTRGRANVILTSVDDGKIPSSADRERGFAEAARRYPQMHIADKVYSDNNYSTLFLESDAYYQKLTQSIQSHPEVDVVYVMNPGDYEVVDMVHQAAGDRFINVITNDLLSEKQKEMLMDGRIAVTIGQEPEKQGARPIEILFEYLAFNRLPIHKWEKTHLDVVLREMDLNHAYLVM